MSIQSNFPAIKPTLLLDFANTEQLDPRISFTRASTATYYGTQTAKAEENLFAYSQEFDNAYWTKTRSTVTANSDTAPDGTVTADSVLQASGQTTSGNVFRSVTVAAGDVVVSVFAKPNGKNFLSIREVLTDGTNKSTWFNVSTGVVGVTSASHTATITATTNGYYRCSIKFTANAARTGNVEFFIADTDGSLTVADDGNGLFLWGAQLEARSAATAYQVTTTQTITNYIPQLLAAASGVARFDHNPTTFESLGLLIEESRTNLFTYSEQFDNAAWSKTAASVTANTIVSPDGTLNADKLVEDATTAIHFTAQVASVTSGTTYTASFYAKKAERTQCGLLFATAGFGTNTVDTFDLNAGTVLTNASGTASITAVGNGWYRVSATRTATATSSSTFQIRIGDAGSFNYLGNGYSGIYIWGAQLESGNFSTSYIPTVASQVTRAADAASMTGTNFSSWYNQAAGTLYAEWQKFAPSTFQAVVAASDGTAVNAIIIGHGSISGSNNSLLFDVLVGNATQASIITIANSPSNTFAKTAAAYAVNDFSVVSNGGSAGTDTLGVLPVPNRLNIGVAGSMISGFLNGTIRKLAYYPLRVTNAQLQALTS